jgi:hypothetical protein
MKSLTPNDLDSHDWAARGIRGSGTGQKVAARIEAIRSHQKSRTTSRCRRHEKLADGEKSQRRDAGNWLTDDPRLQHCEI